MAKVGESELPVKLSLPRVVLLLLLLLEDQACPGFWGEEVGTSLVRIVLSG